MLAPHTVCVRRRNQLCITSRRDRTTISELLHGRTKQGIVHAACDVVPPPYVAHAVNSTMAGRPHGKDIQRMHTFLAWRSAGSLPMQVAMDSWLLSCPWRAVT